MGIKEYFYKGEKIIERDGMFYAYVFKEGDIQEHPCHSLDAAQKYIDETDRDNSNSN